MEALAAEREEQARAVDSYQVALDTAMIRYRSGENASYYEVCSNSSNFSPAENALSFKPGSINFFRSSSFTGRWVAAGKTEVPRSPWPGKDELRESLIFGPRETRPASGFAAINCAGRQEI